MIYLSKTLATEWAPLNVRVNCVAPGAIATSGLNVYPDGAVDHFAHTNPMKRLGDVQDVAEAVVYLSACLGQVRHRRDPRRRRRPHVLGRQRVAGRQARLFPRRSLTRPDYVLTAPGAA